MINTIFILLIAFQVKHFLADYIFQGKYMLKKFSSEYDEWVPALSAHCVIHYFGTLIIAIAYNRGASWDAIGVAALDFVLHFIMDRIKASPSMLGRWKPLTASTYEMYDSMARGIDMEQVDKKTQECLRKEGKQALNGNTYFWWALGFDQTVHHITHYIIIYLLVS